MGNSPQTIRFHGSQSAFGFSALQGSRRNIRDSQNFPLWQVAHSEETLQRGVRNSVLNYFMSDLTGNDLLILSDSTTGRPPPLDTVRIGAGRPL